MKVAVPTTYLRDKEPFGEYWVCDRDIDEENSSNHPFQVPNINFRIDDTVMWSTIVDQSWKSRQKWPFLPITVFA